MANTTKVTKRTVINEMLENEVIKSNDSWVAYLQNEITLLDNRNKSRSGKKSNPKTEGIRKAIVEFLGKVEKATCTEMMNAGIGSSNQSVSANANKLVADGVLDKNKDKGKTYFFLATTDKVDEDGEE